MAYNDNSAETTKTIIEIVDQMESMDKSDFIEDLLNLLTEEQRGEILKSLLTNQPLKL